MATIEVDINKVDQIIDKYDGQGGVLIQALLDIQQELSWIPLEAATQVSERLDIPLSQVYRVASFYKAMSLVPRGKHLVSVCLGTACHVRGGARVMSKVEKVLGIKAGETTPDMNFSMERVNCLGCCALGPTVKIDEDYYGKTKPARVEEVLKRYD